MNLTIHPLTPEVFPALEDLFGTQGPVSRCWCMYWRIGDAYRKRPREKNKAAFREIVKSSLPIGLLAFDGDLAVGWVNSRRAMRSHGWIKRGGSNARTMCPSGRFRVFTSARGIAKRA